MITEIIKNKHDQYYIRIKADNGKILVHSETYKAKKDAINCVDIIRFGFVATYRGTTKDNIKFIDLTKEN